MKCTTEKDGGCELYPKTGVCTGVPLPSNAVSDLDDVLAKDDTRRGLTVGDPMVIHPT